MVYPLSLEFCHPCTSLFALAWEEIGIEYSQIAAVLVEHLVCFHVGMVYGYVLVLLEGDSVEFSCQTEHAVDHLVELQVGAQHLGVEVVFLHLQLVRVEAHVPGFHHEVISFNAFCQGCYLGNLLLGGRLVGIYQVVQQFVHIVDIACHAVLEHVVGIGVEAQQLCQLASQVDESLAYLEVVGIVVVYALGIAGHVHLLAELALCRVSHEGREDREVEGEDPSFLLLFLGILLGCSNGSLGQSVELSLVGDMQLEGFVFLEQVLRELQGEHACLLGELAQLLLAFLIEQGTAAYKTIIACIEQHLFLGIQLAVGMVVYELDAFEEFLVQGDIVGMLGKDGAHLLCQGFHLVAGLCAHHA